MQQVVIDKNNRVAVRNRVLMSATLYTPEGAQKVRVRDLSSEGAQILTQTAVPRGCDAIFRRGAIFVAARVAWSDDLRLGLTFYRRLPASDVQLAFKAREVGV